MVVYQHGISSDGPIEGFPLRMLASSALPVYSGFTTTILDDRGGSLNERAVHLLNPVGPLAEADFYEEGDLRYCVVSMLYHLNRILELYMLSTKMFEDMHPIGTAICGNTSDPRVSYELDAFLGSARRVYEGIRSVLWKHYGRHGSQGWGSVKKIFDNPHRVPAAYLKTLEDNWTTKGKDLRALRDGVAHYSPVTQNGSPCWMDWYGGRWGMTFKLPSNPGVNSRRRYEYDAGPDMLDYCHGTACDLVRLCEDLGRLGEVREHLDHPERGRTWIGMVNDRKESRLDT